MIAYLLFIPGMWLGKHAGGNPTEGNTSDET